MPWCSDWGWCPGWQVSVLQCPCPHTLSGRRPSSPSPAWGLCVQSSRPSGGREGPLRAPSKELEDEGPCPGNHPVPPTRTYRHTHALVRTPLVGRGWARVLRKQPPPGCLPTCPKVTVAHTPRPQHSAFISRWEWRRGEQGSEAGFGGGEGEVTSSFSSCQAGLASLMERQSLGTEAGGAGAELGGKLRQTQTHAHVHTLTHVHTRTHRHVHTCTHSKH